MRFGGKVVMLKIVRDRDKIGLWYGFVLYIFFSVTY